MICCACSPIIEKPQQKDFFKPVDRIVQKKAGSDTLVMAHESNRPYAEDSLKDSLIVLYTQQNNRLSDMIQQLNLLTKRNNTGISKDTDDIGEILANRNQLSNEILLEKIKDQNQRLNDVVKQLKLLAQNQQNQSENHNLVSGTNATHLKPTLAQQIPVLITGANAVPVKAAPAKKVSLPRTPNSSLNYGKAIELYKNQQYAKAIDVFEKLLNEKIEPNLSDRYHFWMGVCYLNLNKTDQAIKALTKVLGYSKSDKGEEAYFMMGQCYERTGEKKSAKMTYEKMLRIYPQGNLKQVAEKKLALMK
jgi:TolA-binding protein